MQSFVERLPSRRAPLCAWMRMRTWGWRGVPGNGGSRCGPLQSDPTDRSARTLTEDFSGPSWSRSFLAAAHTSFDVGATYYGPPPRDIIPESITFACLFPSCTKCIDVIFSIQQQTRFSSFATHTEEIMCPFKSRLTSTWCRWLCFSRKTALGHCGACPRRNYWQSAPRIVCRR